MILRQVPLAGAYLLEPQLQCDDRGFFARSFCRKEFGRAGLAIEFVQSNICFNRRRGTLRGMHWQADPVPECKLVRCTMGAVYDVIVDLRPESPSYGQWFGVELNAENRWALYIPGGFAHGFITLEDSSEVFYEMSEFYRPEYARSLYWNDPDIGIDWPMAPVVLSKKDAAAPRLVALPKV